MDQRIELLPAREARAEIEVLRSRFIASLAPAIRVEEARAFIQRIQSEFPSANHHVPAFLIGHGSSVTAHCSDAGEPAGTAGRPALAVLQGSGLGDVAVVVTRFFGGTKLGTGGLVRAYGDAVKAVLEITPRAQKVLTARVELVVPYRLFERTRQMIDTTGAAVLGEDFAEQVTLNVSLRQDRLPEFQQSLRELSAGLLEARILEEYRLAILPLSE